MSYPRLRLDFYPDTILLSRWTTDGRLTTYPVLAADVVSACTDVPLSSGLLPANTLFWRRPATDTATALGIYIPPRTRSVILVDETLHLPWPPLLFIGHRQTYRIFALKKHPGGDPHTPLYHAPCPNVHPDGRICPGNTPFPICTPDTIMAAFDLFVTGSSFNRDLSQYKCRSFPEDVRQLWAQLAGHKRFPLRELIDSQLPLSQFC